MFNATSKVYVLRVFYLYIFDKTVLRCSDQARQRFSSLVVTDTKQHRSHGTLRISLIDVNANPYEGPL